MLLRAALPVAMETPEVGREYRFERAFSAEAVREFAALSGDDQSRHVETDDAGRLLVHGLLTASLATKIGGDVAMLARELSFEFVEPVYAGETVACTWRTEAVEERAERYDVRASVECENERGDLVMRGTVVGVVEKDDLA